MRLFSEIFEKDGQWLTGRDIAYKIMKHCENRGLEVKFLGEQIIVGIPVPLVKDELSGKLKSIELLVVPELLEEWQYCKDYALGIYQVNEAILLAKNHLKGSPMTPTIKQEVLNIFSNHEHRKSALNLSLSNCVRQGFGLNLDIEAVAEYSF